MILTNPITFTPPPTNRDGVITTYEPVVCSALEIILTDNNYHKIVTVKLRVRNGPSHCVFFLKLWSGKGYDGAGNYTQDMIESKILNLLGDNSSKTIESLIENYNKPQQKIVQIQARKLKNTSQIKMF